jgi:hypothetical protein
MEEPTMSDPRFSDEEVSGRRAGTTMSSGAATSSGTTMTRPGVAYEPAPEGSIATHVRTTGAARTDRVRWGTIWAGLAVAVSTFLVLQLALIATGVVDLANPTSSDAIASGVAAAVAFLLGGIVTGATARWRGFDDGLLHGVVLWAVGLVALGVLSVAGSGLALGSFDTSQAFDNIRTDQSTRVEASDNAKDAAGKALAGATIALIAAAAGGEIGAKMWPRDEEDDIDLRDTRAY